MTDDRKKLFRYKNPYDLIHTQDYFFHSVLLNVSYHKEHCIPYRMILEQEGFELDCLNTIEDLYKIPVIPTLYLKEHSLFSMEDGDYVMKAASSGTKGKQSVIGIDKESLKDGMSMALHMFLRHKLISPIPVHYIVLGYEPSGKDELKDNLMARLPLGAAKTAYGATKFAPAISRSYALRNQNGEYKLDIEGLVQFLLRYGKTGFPVRLLGFPSYLYYLLRYLQEHRIRLKLPKRSLVLLGGGWKRFASEQVDKEKIYQMVEETLGIGESDCREFFSAVEHPVMYCDCKNHHFHVPIYSRVIIRDVKSLLPVPMGNPGLLSFVTPLMKGVPLTSVVTDDLAVLYEGASCGCGIESPYFEVLGRVGMTGIKTCAAGAAEFFGGKE